MGEIIKSGALNKFTNKKRFPGCSWNGFRAGTLKQIENHVPWCQKSNQGPCRCFVCGPCWLVLKGNQECANLRQTRVNVCRLWSSGSLPPISDTTGRHEDPTPMLRFLYSVCSVCACNLIQCFPLCLFSAGPQCLNNVKDIWSCPLAMYPTQQDLILSSVAGMALSCLSL